MQLNRYRDLTVCKQAGQGYLVIACDSAGGIGPKPGDAVKSSGEVLGYYTAHVVLAELIAAGAEPFLIINALAVEAVPTGEAILSGVRRAAEEAGLGTEAITGSTEENIPVNQTGLGMTALGEAASWPLYQSEPGDLLVLAGTPRVGEEVLRQGDRGRLSLKLLKTLRNEAPFDDLIGEILPVGSRGALAEARSLSETAGCSFRPFDNLPPEAHASGGPSTCGVLSLKPRHWTALKEHSPLPLLRLGELIPGAGAGESRFVT